MKKLLSLLLILALIATIAACTGQQDPADPTTDAPPMDSTDDTTVEDHTHMFSSKWEKDETNHWHICTDDSCDEASEAVAHAYDEGRVTKPATEQETGTKVYTCTVCGYEKNETIEKLPHTHTPADAVEEKRTEATCTTDGTYDTVVYCTVCSAQISRKTTKIPATGHSFNNEDDDTCNTCGVKRLSSDMKYANEYSQTTNRIYGTADGIALDTSDSHGRDLPLAGNTIPGIARKQPLTGNWQVDVKISGSALFTGGGGYASYGINLQAGNKHMKLVVQDRGDGGCTGQCVQFFGTGIGETNVNWPDTTTTWLRFIKDGNKLISYASVDGEVYTLINMTTVPKEFDSVELQIFATQLQRGASYVATVHSVTVSGNLNDTVEEGIVEHVASLIGETIELPAYDLEKAATEDERMTLAKKALTNNEEVRRSGVSIELKANPAGGYTITVAKGNSTKTIDSVRLVGVTTVSFRTNGGSLIPDVKIYDEAACAEPGAPTRSQYTFQGWYTDRDLTEKYDFSKTVTKDLILYAKWTRDDNYEFYKESVGQLTAHQGNPYMALWEHVPDGEPYIFEDPDHPGQYRVYVYGSHDTLKVAYCGYDFVVWSAPVDDLTQWRYDGIIFEAWVDGSRDHLLAPAVAEMVDEKTGKKSYFIYSNNVGGRTSMVAKADRPDGPFEIYNWAPNSNTAVEGPIGFDPAVLVEDGKVYVYWGGPSGAYYAQMDPTTMSTVIEGELPHLNVPGCQSANVNVADYSIYNDEHVNDWRFYEGSSIRKVGNKYVFIYSREGKSTEPEGSGVYHQLAYGYSDSPTGPWKYGGIIVDAAGEVIDNGDGTYSRTFPSDNTHGSICEINGQWYIFYHRSDNKHARQAMVDAITVEWDEKSVADGGAVRISRAEVTSKGFYLNGLDPYAKHTFGIASYMTGGATIAITYDKTATELPVTNIKDGAVIGIKYFNFDGKKVGTTHLDLELKPLGVDAVIDVYLRPTTAVNTPITTGADGEINSVGVGSYRIGSVELTSDMAKTVTSLRIPLAELDKIDGQWALFFVVRSEKANRNICELYNMQCVSVSADA